MGDSERDKAVKQSYNEIGNINPQVDNLFAGYKPKFSADDILASIDAYVNNAIGNTQKRTAGNISRSNRNIASRFAGQGIKGGAILEDALGAGENRQNIIGANEIEGLQNQGLSLRPGVFNRQNQLDFNITGANQNVLFQNLANLFRKNQMRFGAANAQNDDTTFDDILASMNAAGNLAKGVAPFL